MLTLAAVLLASTLDVTNGLTNLTRMHRLTEVVELRRGAGLGLPADLPPDPWGTPYRIEEKRIVSAGSDRQFEANPQPGQFEGIEGDVVFENGLLVRSNRNWLYERVESGTESANALNELREAELSFMYMRAPLLQDLLRVKMTVEGMLAGETAVDGWGTPIRVEGSRKISAGADRQFDPESWIRPAENDVRQDIVVENGTVVRMVDSKALIREKAPAAEVIPQPVDMPRPADGKYRRVGGNVTAPAVLNRVEPRYVEAYRRASISGMVIVEALISEEGVVEDVRLLKSRAPELDAAAMNAVRQWTFEPGRAEGQPVPVIFSLTINFKLK